MTLTREQLAQIGHIARPLHVRIANMVQRATVQLVDDTGKLQMLQIGALGGETPPDAEHFQPYGFTSVPPVGAGDGVVLFPNGDGSHPIVIVMGDRRSRPTGGAAGDVSVYNAAGARITLSGANVHVQPGAGGHVLVDDGSGAAALPTMADFGGIISILNSAGTGAATALPAAVAAYQAAHPTWPVGTTVLDAK